MLPSGRMMPILMNREDDDMDRPQSMNDEPTTVTAEGVKLWYQNTALHREGDLPAMVHADGEMVWLRKDRLHRDGDRPTTIDAYGLTNWYRNDVWEEKYTVDEVKSVEYLGISYDAPYWIYDAYSDHDAH